MTPRRIAVIGTGYVGLTTGASLSSLGHDVVCVDRDLTKVEALRDGDVPIHELGLTKLVHDGIAAGRLAFEDDTCEHVRDRDVVLLCLPTPTGGDGGADLTAVLAVAHQIREHLSPGTVVVTKSTVPVGTGQLVVEALERTDVHVASNPEFLREGTAVQDFFTPDRVVVGGNEPGVADRVAELYAELDSPIVCTDRESAELIKYASNALLAIKLSFVNDLSALCERTGADVDEVTTGLGMDGRISERFLQPGPGWGGSCFPKDTLALSHMSDQVGLDFPLLDAAITANDGHVARVADRLDQLVEGGIAGRDVGVLGLTFKAGTDDLRDSPALRVVELLRARGAHVHAYDPTVADADGLGLEPSPDLSVHADPYSACRDTAAVVILTEWDEFGELDLDKLAGVTASPLVFDTRATIDAEGARQAGLELVSLGRGDR